MRSSFARIPIICVAVQRITQLRELCFDDQFGLLNCGQIGLNRPALQHTGICGTRDLVDVAADPVELANDRAKCLMLARGMLHW